MLMEMKPARMGSIKPNAALPMVLKSAAAGEFMPKLAGSPPGARMVSRRKAIAIKMPPPMTKGSMLETPFIRCL